MVMSGLVPKDVRQAAYRGMLRPTLEYGSSVWGPHYEGLIDELEKVRKRAARFVTVGSKRYTCVNKSAAGMHDTPPRKFNLAKMFVNKFSR